MHPKLLNLKKFFKRKHMYLAKFTHQNISANKFLELFIDIIKYIHVIRIKGLGIRIKMGGDGAIIIKQAVNEIDFNDIRSHYDL